MQQRGRDRTTEIRDAARAPDTGGVGGDRPEPAGWRPDEPAPRPPWLLDTLGDAEGRGVRVGVVDSGWDRGLADPRVSPGVGLVDPDDELALRWSDDDADRHGHGTACAALVLRAAPGAEVVPIRVFGRRLETSWWVLHEGLRWALEQRLDVVNVSLGTQWEASLRPLYTLCEVARRAGVIVVAAGRGADEPSYPAVFENAVGVGAAPLGSPFDFRYGADDALEVVASGIDQPVTWLGGRRETRSGTSFAAPHVAGLVASYRERHPRAPLEEVRDFLAAHARRT
jgi:subtilisin family serine protease